MERWVQDVRYSVRALRVAPVVSMAAVLSLALAIGAATGIFSVVDGVLLKPFPVKAQERLLVVWTSKPERAFAHWPFSYAGYQGMRERLRTTSGVGAHPYAGVLTAVLHLDDGSAMPVQRTAVTGEWFDVLGVRARAGRLLTAADDQVGAPNVVVLSAGLAERLFGSAVAAVGRSVRIQEHAFAIVGVTPVDFDYPRTAEAWVPAVRFRDTPEVAWDLVVRVGPDFTIEQTRADLAAALRTLPPESGPLGSTEKQVIHAQAFADAVVGEVRSTLLILGGAVLLMLIVAGVNVANLLLVRGLARRRELSVRAAVGATRQRIFQQLATEAMVLAAAGAVPGILVAYLSLSAFLALAPPELPRVAQIAIDARALGFAAGAAAAVAVLFGVLPGLQTATIEPAEVLRAPESSAAWGTRQYLATSWPRSGADCSCDARAVHCRTAGKQPESHAAAGSRVRRTRCRARRRGHSFFPLCRRSHTPARDGAAGRPRSDATGHQQRQRSRHASICRNRGSRRNGVRRRTDDRRVRQPAGEL